MQDPECRHCVCAQIRCSSDCISPKEGKRGRWDFHICSTKKNTRDHKCTSKRVGARILEQSVLDSLMNHVLTRDNLRPLADVISAQLAQTNTDAGLRLTALRNELEPIERQITNRIGAIEDMGLSPSLKEKLTKRESEKERLKAEIALLERTLVKTSDLIVLESAYVIAKPRHQHKRELKAEIRRLRDGGFSLREIAEQVGLHWTRVWQILT